METLQTSPLGESTAGDARRRLGASETATDQQRIFRDTALNVATLAVSSLSGLVLIPLLFHSARVELYGAWLTAFALAETATIVNAGLGRSVSRHAAECAASARGSRPGEFVSAAGMAFALLGVIGAGYIVALRGPIVSALGVTTELKRDAHRLFILVAARFFFGQLTWFSTEALAGLGRFDRIALISTSGSLIRVCVFLLLLRARVSLVDLAVADVVLAVVLAGMSLIALHRSEPAYVRFRGGIPWKLLVPHLRYGSLVQLSSICNMLLYDSGALLLGMLRGAAAVVPFEVGRRVPCLIERINWQASMATFPVAADAHRRANQTQGAHVLRWGTRTVLAIALPLCSILYLLAPQLNALWMRATMPDAVGVMRVLIIAMLLDATAAAAYQSLWSQGRAGLIMILVGSGTAITLILSVLFIKAIGPVGCAVAIAAGVALSAAGGVMLACHYLRASPFSLLLQAIHGKVIPTAVCSVMVAMWIRTYQVQTWRGCVLVMLAAGTVYTQIVLVLPANSPERAAVKYVGRWLFSRLDRSSRGTEAAQGLALERHGPEDHRHRFAVRQS